MKRFYSSFRIEKTPNPLSIKIYPPNGKQVLKDGTLNFNSVHDAQRNSFASQIFQIKHVKGVFLAKDFLTITKEASANWEVMTPKILKVLQSFYKDNHSLNEEGSTFNIETNDEVILSIHELLDTKIRPFVQQDGGDVKFHSFDSKNGKLFIKLEGSCSTCESNSSTLNGYIEKIFKYYIPEVKQIEQIFEKFPNLETLKKYEILKSKNVFMKTFGCSHNMSDSEYMAGQLIEKGYGITEDFENADIYLINSCTVKNPSEHAFDHLVQKAKKTNKPVVISGCVPQSDNLSKYRDVSVIGVHQIENVVQVVEEAFQGNIIHLTERTKHNKPKLELPKFRKNPFIEIIPINVGCLNFCTYCKTKHARGNLSSYPIHVIVERVKQVIKEGVKEIRLTSEDTGAYGIELKTNIVELLNAILKELPPDVMLRIGMTNPPYILKHLEKISEILKLQNVYEFLHIPVQSASNKVLFDMRRMYTKEKFKTVIDTLKKNVPNINIGTDIICGFPTENEEDFQETMKLVEEYKFPFLNISQFYPRPGTIAAEMKRIPTKIVKERSTRLSNLFRSYTTFDDMIGTKHKVWITEIASDGHHLIGHTKNYTQVLIDPNEAMIGSSCNVEITETSKYFVKGKVI